MGQHYVYVQGPPPAPNDRLSPVGDMQLGEDVAPHTHAHWDFKDGFVGVRNVISAFSGRAWSHPAVVRLTGVSTGCSDLGFQW